MTGEIYATMSNGQPAVFPADTTPAELHALGATPRQTAGQAVASVDSGLGESVAQGATLGAGDELAAWLRSKLPGVSNFMTQPNAFEKSVGVKPAIAPVDEAAPDAQRYDQELAKTRQRQKDYHEAHPYFDTGGKIAGAVMSTLGALPASALRGGTAAATIGKNALVGAGVGGVTGFNEGEGGAAKRLDAAIIPAATGLGLGAAAPVVAPIVGKAVAGAGRWTAGKIGDAIEALASSGAASRGNVRPAMVEAVAAGGGDAAPAAGSMVPAPKGASAATDIAAGGEAGVTPAAADQSRALRLARALQAPRENAPVNAAHERLARAMSEAGVTPDQGKVILADLGAGATIADIDRVVTDLARDTFAKPGRAKGLFRENFGARREGAGDRLTTAGRENIADDVSFVQAKEANTAKRTATARQLYGEVRDAGLNVTPELQRMLSTPLVKKAVETIKATDKSLRPSGLTLAEAGERPTLAGVITDPILANRVKSVLRGLKDRAFNGTNPDPDKGQKLGDFYRAFRGELHAANPKLAEANRAYHADSRVQEFMDHGRTFMRGGTNETTDAMAPHIIRRELDKATPEQAHAFLVGMQDAWRSTVRGSSEAARGAARKLPGQLDIMDRLREAVGKERADKLLAKARTEFHFNETENMVQGGSDTFSKAAGAAHDAAPVLKEAAEGVGHAIAEPLTGSLKLAKTLLSHFVGKNPHAGADMRYELAKILSNHADPAANQATLDLVKRLMTSRSQLARVPTPVGGAVGGTQSAP